MSLRRLKWLTILSPLVFFGLIGAGREILFPSLFGSWPGYLLLAGIVLIAALFFSEAVFNIIDRTQEQLEQTNRALAMAEERERIAREIHDSVAQVLGYVNTKAQAAEELLHAGRHDAAAAQISQLGAAARDAYADVREHILGLRTAATVQRDFLATLTEYLARWKEQSGVVATLVTEPAEGFAPRLPATAELQLLRIIQEGLSNVRKHAGATVVTVHLLADDGWIEARIEDNGTGFDPSATSRADYPRFGLSTMRERAEAVGGSLAIESAAGRGTRVVARMREEPGLAASRTAT